LTAPGVPRFLAVVAGVALGGALLACGSRGGALPEPQPCEQPQSDDTAGAEPGANYLTAVREGKGRVLRPAFEFLTRWPSRKYSRRQMFREELADAVDESVCASLQLRSLTPPSAAYAEYDAALDNALYQYEQQMTIGREAAELRNVTKFREWLDAVDSFPATLDSLDLLLPGN